MKLVFLGCGWATRLHARILGAHPMRPEIRFASRDRTKAIAYARRYGGTRAYPCYGDALADDAVDTVVVATPPADHLDRTLAALAAGKHVVVEKPAFPRAADVDSVARAAAQAGRRVFVAENYYYKPLRRLLARLLADGVVGRPLFLDIDATREQRTGGWRDAGGPDGIGALLEGGIHWIHLLGNLGLTIRRVQAFEPGRNGGPERSVLVVIEYAGGPVATLRYSWETPTFWRGLRRSRLAGTAGTVTFETNGLVALVHGRRPRLLAPGLRDIAGYRAMWTDFLCALQTGTTPGMTIELAAHDLRLVEVIYASRR